MAEYTDRERFIPFSKAQIIDMLCTDGKLNKNNVEKFRKFCRILDSIYHFEFHSKLEYLKENYYPFDPDKDTKFTNSYSEEELLKFEKNLVSKFREILNDANYEEITEQELNLALKEESIFKISLYVDFDDFDSYSLFWRGHINHKEKIRKYFFKEIDLDVPTFERVAMLIKFKKDEYFKQKKRKIAFEPGSTIIKLFKNIPKADLEMLFPNTQIKMKLKDKIIMLAAAIGGGIGVFTKTAAGIIAMLGVIWFFILNFGNTEPVRNILSDPEKMGALIAGISGIGVITAFLIKQWVNYKNRKIKFMKTLGDNLYFKNLDNNKGVFFHLINDAEEEEFKESILGYYFLLFSEQGLTEIELDDEIENWFGKKYNVLIDFEIKDSLRKLNDLKLCQIVGENKNNMSPIYKVIGIDEGFKHLDNIWDNFFQN
ncbi:MAG: DUF3754 domain-containing protein [Desulfobacterales bacterium]|nr:DUF3754 domain-containing protein [Desulfobacterales bacterium]